MQQDRFELPKTNVSVGKARHGVNGFLSEPFLLDSHSLIIAFHRLLYCIAVVLSCLWQFNNFYFIYCIE